MTAFSANLLTPCVLCLMPLKSEHVEVTESFVLCDLCVTSAISASRL